jgi:hypothetical protein
MTWPKASEVLVKYNRVKKQIVHQLITKTFITAHQIWLLDGMQVFYSLFSKTSAFLSTIDKPAAVLALAHASFNYLKAILRTLPETHVLVMVVERKFSNPLKGEEHRKRELAKQLNSSEEEMVKNFLKLDFKATEYEKERLKVEKVLGKTGKLSSILEEVKCVLISCIDEDRSNRLLMVTSCGEAEAHNAYLQHRYSNIFASVTTDCGDHAGMGGTTCVIRTKCTGGKMTGRIVEMNDVLSSPSFVCQALPEQNGYFSKFGAHALLVLNLVHVLTGSDFFAVGGPSIAPTAKTVRRGVYGLGNKTAMELLLPYATTVSRMRGTNDAFNYLCDKIFQCPTWIEAVTGLNDAEVREHFRNAVRNFYYTSAIDLVSAGANQGNLFEQFREQKCGIKVIPVNDGMAMSPGLLGNNDATRFFPDDYESFNEDQYFCRTMKESATYNTVTHPDYVAFMNFHERPKKERQQVYRLAPILSLKSIASMFQASLSPYTPREVSAGIIERRIANGWKFSLVDTGQQFQTRNFDKYKLLAQGVKVLQYLRESRFGKTTTGGNLHRCFERALMRDGGSKLAPVSVTQVGKAINHVFGHYSLEHIKVYEAPKTTGRIIFHFDGVIPSMNKDLYQLDVVFEDLDDDLDSGDDFYKQGESVCSCVAGLRCGHVDGAVLFVGVLISSLDYYDDFKDIVPCLPLSVGKRRGKVNLLHRHYRGSSQFDYDYSDDGGSDADNEENNGEDNDDVEEEVDSSGANDDDDDDDDKNSNEGGGDDGDDDDDKDSNEGGGDDGERCEDDEKNESGADYNSMDEDDPNEEAKGEGMTSGKCRYFEGNLLDKIVKIIFEKQSFSGYPKYVAAHEYQDIYHETNVKDRKQMRDNATLLHKFLKKSGVTGVEMSNGA